MHGCRLLGFVVPARAGRSRAGPLVCVAAGLAVAASAVEPAAGQEPPSRTGTLAGVVQDTTGQPLALVEVTVALEIPRTVRTDSAGAFRLADLPPGVHRVSFRRIGFVPAAWDLTVPAGSARTVTVLLESQPPLLDTVVVTAPEVSPGLARVGFYDRKRQRDVGAGAGTFVTPEEVERLRLLPRTTYLLEAAARVRLQSTEGGQLYPVGRSQVVISGALATGRILMGPCQMAVFIDGIEVDIGHYSGGGRGGGLDDQIHPSNIRAIEVYHSGSTTPQQFMSTRRAGCGAIVIWSKAN